MYAVLPVMPFEVGFVRSQFPELSGAVKKLRHAKGEKSMTNRDKMRHRVREGSGYSYVTPQIYTNFRLA